jgi:2-iminobutanoate/2-iminopropanoate deaminase
MKKQVIEVASLAPALGPFTRAISAGEFLFISGTSALSHLPGSLATRPISSGITAQTRQTLENIRLVLEAAGLQFKDIIKLTVMLKNVADYEAMNAVRAEYFNGSSTTSSTFIADLIRDDMLVEIEAIAVRS